MRTINLSHFELKLMDKARELFRELRSDELVRIGDGKGERFTTATLCNAKISLERQTSMLAEDAKHFVGRRVVDAGSCRRQRIPP